MLTWGSTSIGIKQAVGARLWDGLISTHDMRYQRAKTVCLQWSALVSLLQIDSLYGIVLSELCPFTLSLLSPFREETWVWFLCQGCPAPIDVATSIIAVMPDGCGPRITQLPRSCQGQLLGPSLPQALEILFGVDQDAALFALLREGHVWHSAHFWQRWKVVPSLSRSSRSPQSSETLWMELLHGLTLQEGQLGSIARPGKHEPLPSTSHSHSTSKQAASLAGSSTPIQNTTPVYQRIQFYQISNRGIVGRRSYRSYRATSLKLQRTIKKIRNPPGALTPLFLLARSQSQEKY